jgi:hypothetical protein
MNDAVTPEKKEEEKDEYYSFRFRSTGQMGNRCSWANP